MRPPSVAMPPPVPSGAIDLLQPCHWPEYWRRHPDGMGDTISVGQRRVAEPTNYCASCGEWPYTPIEFLSEHISKDVLSGLRDTKILCRDCAAWCRRCKYTITTMQRARHNGACRDCERHIVLPRK